MLQAFFCKKVIFFSETLQFARIVSIHDASRDKFRTQNLRKRPIAIKIYKVQRRYELPIHSY
jgi:hypothetical protein